MPELAADFVQDDEDGPISRAQFLYPPGGFGKRLPRIWRGLRGGRMSGQELLIILLVGLIAGWLAGQIVRGTGYGLIADIAIGIVGALIGAWLLPQLGIHLGGVYRCGPILVGMVPNAQKHLEVADLYEKLSADENASIEWRIAFARKANWHRILARMSAEREHPVVKEKASDGEQALRSETTLFYQIMERAR